MEEKYATRKNFVATSETRGAIVFVHEPTQEFGASSIGYVQTTWKKYTPRARSDYVEVDYDDS